MAGVAGSTAVLSFFLKAVLAFARALMLFVGAMFSDMDANRERWLGAAMELSNAFLSNALVEGRRGIY